MRLVARLLAAVLADRDGFDLLYANHASDGVSFTLP